MHQLFFIERGRLEWREVSEPKIKAPTDALVRPLAVARCDLDVGILMGHETFTGPGPFPLGHEFVGEIEVLGDAVARFVLGQRVIVPFQISCGSCVMCTAGLTGQCIACADDGHKAMYGLGVHSRVWGGALCAVVRVPFADHMLIPVPNGLDLVAIASVSDNMVDGWRAVAGALTARPGANVLILGGGSIGIYAAAFARTLGAGRVDYLDTHRERLSLAERVGGTPIPGKPKTASRINADAADHIPTSLESTSGTHPYRPGSHSKID